MKATKLHGVSDRLDSLAGEHPQISEALITISESVRNTATLLQVLVATKMSLPPGPDPETPDCSSISLPSAGSFGHGS
jgi:hypothetical protein